MPDSPAYINLAQFGLQIPQNVNYVELIATVGFRATVLTPTILFKVFRDNQVIYSTKEEADVSVAEYQTVSFQSVDVNPPSGGHNYFISAEILNPTVGLNQAVVVGPISFTGKVFVSS